MQEKLESPSMEEVPMINYSMKINKEKTQVLVCSRKEWENRIRINIKSLKNHPTNTAQGKQAFDQKKKALERCQSKGQQKTSPGMTVEYCLPWIRILDGRNNRRKNLESFEMLCYRRMLTANKATLIDKLATNES